jgi:MFS family permease
MVGTFIPSDQGTDVVTAPGSARARTWTLTVACMGVSLVIASMVALNAALGDIAMAMSATQSQLTWVVDGYTLVLACLLLPAGAIGDRMAAAEPCSSVSRSLRSPQLRRRS